VEPELVIRARVVVPINQTPIRDGAVVIAGERIKWIGRSKELRSRREEILDLGEVAVLPGLVNAHCHLDYTNMAGLSPPPRRFTDWIKVLTTLKAEWTYSDFAESWLAGANMLVRTGTTTVGDIESVPELLPEVWEATPLRVHSFLEMTGVKSRRKPRVVLEEMLRRVPASTGARCLVGLSPHAPYSTLPELLRLSAQTAARRGWRLCTHVSESEQEFEMFTEGRGEMFEWLQRSERDMSDCGKGTPVQHMERNGALGPETVAVHVNYLGEGDAGILGRRKVSVVHCPRSHAYFRHEPFPLATMKKARVNVCLGTDSLASVYKRRGQEIELSMFEEMRTFARHNPNVSRRNIVEMATSNGARALGMQREAGELRKGAFADLIAIPFAGRASEVYEAIVTHKGAVVASMVGGKWVIRPEGSDE
jgi:aminodeoxyfutalosine deaminase